MTRSNADTKVAHFWDHESRDWGDKYGRRSSYFYRRRTFQSYFSATGIANGSVLDYGCGAGDITFPMLQAGNKVTGIDIAEGMVRKASERAAHFGFSDRATYHHLSDAVIARISAMKFDAVVCSSVLEYVEDDGALLRMFRNVLVDGGYLLVSVPDRKSLFCRIDRWLYANRSILPKAFPIAKLGYLDIQQRQYDVPEFIERVESLGFALQSRKHNTVTLQRGLLMEKISNIPGIGMLALLMFRSTSKPA